MAGNNANDKLISGASDSDAGKLVVNLTISEREAIRKAAAQIITFPTET